MNNRLNDKEKLKILKNLSAVMQKSNSEEFRALWLEKIKQVQRDSYRKGNNEDQNRNRNGYRNTRR